MHSKIETFYFSHLHLPMQNWEKFKLLFLILVCSITFERFQKISSANATTNVQLEKKKFSLCCCSVLLLLFYCKILWVIKNLILITIENYKFSFFLKKKSKKNYLPLSDWKGCYRLTFVEFCFYFTYENGLKLLKIYISCLK